jgi:ribosomal subunit interface protein
MNARILFKNMDHSEAMEGYANDQLAKIFEFLGHEATPVLVDLVLAPSHVHAHHKVELRVKTPHYDRVSWYEGPEFYDVLDRVIDTMYKELHEDKQRLIDDRKMVGRHDEFKKQR